MSAGIRDLGFALRLVRRTPLVSAAVDCATGERAIEIRLRAADAHDLRDGAGGAGRECARCADQADTDDRKLVDSHALVPCQCRARSAVSSAARKRAFSAGTPTVTRSHDGRS